MTTALRGAVFLDKDGTLLENVPYNVDPALMRFTAGAPEALAAFHAAGYLLIVVSNQSGVARGLFPEDALLGVADQLRRMFEECGVPLTGFYYCPHHPAGTIRCHSIDCDCRKPASGLVLRAARDYRVDLRGSWLVGDILDDVEAGRRAGCATLLLDVGHETEWRLSPARTPEAMAGGLLEASHTIIQSRSLVHDSDHGKLKNE